MAPIGLSAIPGTVATSRFPENEGRATYIGPYYVQPHPPNPE